MLLIKNLTIDLNKIFIGFTNDTFNTQSRGHTNASREPGPHKFTSLLNVSLIAQREQS